MDARADVVCFGTYDPAKNPRMHVLVEGLRAYGLRVEERYVPVGFDSKQRTEMLRKPWKLALFFLRLLSAWTELWFGSRTLRETRVVIVGWMGYLDIHLARRRFPRATIVLDHLTSLAETADDRDAGSGRIRRMLARLDDRALQKADVVIVDTREHLDDVPETFRVKALEVPVGAASEWQLEPRQGSHDRLRVLFFGQYTPLQAGPVIGEAISECLGAAIDFTMVGDGQDLDATMRAAHDAPNVRWIRWLPPDELRRTAFEHDVCLGVFGTGPKALRVVPNKVYQGAAAGLAIVTSDTPPQRRAFEDAAIYVEPGNVGALAGALRALASDKEHLWRMRVAAHARAATWFRASTIAQPLVERLATRTP